MGEAGRFSATDHRRHPVAAGADVGPIRNERRRPGDARGGRNAPKSTTLAEGTRATRSSARFRRARRHARRPRARPDAPIGPPTSLSTHRRGGENASRRETRSRRGKRRTSEGGFLPPFFLDLLGAMLTDGGEGGRGVVAARRARAKCGARGGKALFCPEAPAIERKSISRAVRGHTANGLVHSLEKTMRSVRVRGNMGLFRHTRGC